MASETACSVQSADFKYRLGLVSGLVALVVVVLCSATTSYAASPAWRIIAGAGPTNLPPVASEIQTVEVDATGGTFTLSFGASTTPAMAFDASPVDVAEELNSLASIAGAGGVVEVSGARDDEAGRSEYFVLFGGALTGTDVGQLIGDATQLTGGAHTAVVGTKTVGGTPGRGALVVYPTNVGGSATAGLITLKIGPLPGGIVTAGPVNQLGADWSCTPGGAGQNLVTCTSSASVPALENTAYVEVPLRIEPAALTNSSVDVSIEGGSAMADPEKGNEIEVPLPVSSQRAPGGIQAFWAGAFDENGRPAIQAGGHPHSAMTFFLLNSNLSPGGRPVPARDVKDALALLPPGFVGNPSVTDKCPQAELVPPSLGSGLCDSDSVVGRARPLTQVFGEPADLGNGIYNGEPSLGYAGEFAFKIYEAKQSIAASLRSDEDYGVTAAAINAPTVFRVFGAAVLLDGAPPAAHGKAFLTNPTNCAEQVLSPPITRLRANNWQSPSLFTEMSSASPPVSGCELLEFEPEFTFQPVAGSAATGVGAVASLSVDQERLLDPEELAPPHLKKSVVTLPEGMVLNPSAADGLKACSTAQMGLKGTSFPAPNPIRFNLDPVACPDGAKIGTVEVTTPLLEKPLNGTVYLAAQEDNPFKSLLAMYLVVEDDETGITIKIPGRVTPNQSTGQLTAEFDNNPQVPFSDLELQFRGGGPRSTMATPDVCGKYTTRGSFTPWSAPESGPPAQTEDSFNITSGVGGSAACPQTKAQRPFGLGFEAGTGNTQAGGDAPFSLRITRPDGNQELDKVTMKMPLGLTAKLKGVETCSDAQVAAAQAPGRKGKTEMQSPSCPANSQVGTTTIGAGVGSNPFYVKTGKVYLTGPYKGAPISLAFIVPAVAGPFDLGVQVVRTALQVNPTTAEITAESDPIPQILEGIPLQIRDVRVDIDRPGFTRNPTSCEPMAVSGQVTGGSGAVANVSNRFQVGNCGALGFKPKLKLKYTGATKRSGNPGLRAVLTQPEGQANISYTQVVLPQGSFIDNEHINNPCTRAQWAANACPKSSILGTAKAWSPLLDQPLQGYVYFRSNGGERELPDVVASLKGQVNIELVGFVDAIENKKKGTSRVRNTFAIVPDAPVSRFELNMKGGKVGLIENSKDLCKGKNKATVRMNAHNGKRLKTEPVVQVACKKKPGKKNGSKGGKKRRAERDGAALGRMHR